MISLAQRRDIAATICRARPRFNSEASARKRDLYSEVSARIVAELERGAAPWIKSWAATAGLDVPQNAVTNWCPAIELSLG
jgi:antirestriction factor ArdC-like protein